MNKIKKEIVDAFSSSAVYYDEHAVLQKDVAGRMARALDPWKYSLPEGVLFEIGAGTGFFTKHLIEMFPNRKIIVTDISEQMLSCCKKNCGENGNLVFKNFDAEEEVLNDSSYALIAGNFVAQWFKNPSQALSRISSALKPGGLMLMSFPGSESYPQWKKYCHDLGLPFTANPLPDIEEVVVNLSMGPVKVDYYEDQSTETFSDVFEFFRHLKRCGTSVNVKGNVLSPKQIRLLNDYWLKQNNGVVHVHYHTAFIAVKRDLQP